MTRLLCTALLVAFSLLSYGQEQDQRLLSRYSSEELNHLEAKQPYLIEFWTFFLDHGYEVYDLAPEKSHLELEVMEVNLENFNILDMDFESIWTNGKSFRIKGTDQVLSLLAKEQFIRKFNKHRESK